MTPFFVRLTHLCALAFATVGAVAILVAARLEGAHLAHRYVYAFAPESFSLKNQGIALQRSACEKPDLLPLYGSSELIKPIPNKAARFFRRYPTEFEVFPIGKAGTTSLIILQKLAGVGEPLRGKKVAISVSPSWFMTAQIPPHYYAGNFSNLQASELAFGSTLSWDLKADIARRMLEFPETIESRSLLAFALRHLAGGSNADRFLYAVSRPFRRLQLAILHAQDEFETARYILEVNPRKAQPHRLPREVDWETFLAHAAQKVSPTRVREEELGGDWKMPESFGDAQFLMNLEVANEWRDFELLLRTLRECGARPLIMSMPLNGPWYDRIGVSRAARSQYLERLRALTSRYGIALCAFEDHEEDPRFLADHHDHLSIEGWMYYNRTLDDFFHDRIPRS